MGGCGWMDEWIDVWIDIDIHDGYGMGGYVGIA